MFTIVKIYDEVLQDSRLRSLEEKLIVSHILQFQNEGKCCFVTNSRFGRFLDRDETFVSQTIFSLSDRGIIKITYPKSGGARFLSVITSEEDSDCHSDYLDLFHL